MSIVAKTLATVLAIAAVATAAGCGDETGGTASDPRQGSSARTTDTGGASNGLLPGKVITTKEGAVVGLPPRPTVTSVAPEPGCQEDGRLLRPPAPGLRARRTAADRVVVSYWFSEVDESCRPATLEVIFDINDDGLPGFGRIVPVSGRSGTVTVDLPARKAAADVLSAITRTDQGLPGRSAHVLID